MEPIILEIKNRPLAFKNNAPFISCISKINGVLVENAGDLDTVMPMDNWLKGCVHYIFASLFFKSKREHLSN